MWVNITSQMTEPTSLINIGELSKPATVLVEKISEAVGGLFRPYQIVRIAKAEAEADRIRTDANIQLTDLHRRAFERFLHEEARKQQNMEEITRNALPGVGADARPDEVDDDWLANFFDKCRLTSDKEVQQIWSRILSGEANHPGTFARRTVNVLASLDKADAEQFAALCSYCWMIGGPVPLVFDFDDQIYHERGITFDVLSHLDSIGLVHFEPLTGFERRRIPKEVVVSYFDENLNLSLPKDRDNQIQIGKILLTKVGLELAPICTAERHPRFFSYVRDKWRGLGYLPGSSGLPTQHAPEPAG